MLFRVVEKILRGGFVFLPALQLMQFFLEICKNMSSDSFLNAFIRFLIPLVMLLKRCGAIMGRIWWVEVKN